MLRRLRASEQADEENQIETHGVTIDLDRHQVLTEDGAIELTATEFKLITLFARSPGRVFSRDILMDVILGDRNITVLTGLWTHMSAVSGANSVI